MPRLSTAICAAALLAGCSPSDGADAPAAGSPTGTAAAPEAVVPASAGSGVQPFAAGSMPIHPVQVNATLTSLTGVDTTRAAMAGRVTEADAREFCERDPNGEAARSSIAECVRSTLESERLAEIGPVHTASANCAEGSLTSSDWGSFRLTGTERPEGGSVTSVFVNNDGVRVMGNADGGASAAALFQVLCPARARVWMTPQ